MKNDSYRIFMKYVMIGMTTKDYGARQEYSIEGILGSNLRSGHVHQKYDDFSWLAGLVSSQFAKVLFTSGEKRQKTASSRIWPPILTRWYPFNRC